MRAIIFKNMLLTQGILPLKWLTSKLNQNKYLLVSKRIRKISKDCMMRHLLEIIITFT